VSAPLSHLLVVTPGFAASEEDTASIPAVQQFVLSFRKVYPQVRISVISFHYPYKKDEYCWHGANVYAIGNKHAGGIRKVLSFSRFMRIGRRINRSTPIDGILCLWLTDSTLAGKLLAKKLNVPWLVWMHGQDAKADNKYVRIVNPPMAQLAAISPQQSQLFEANFQNRPGYIIQNGINPEIFPELNTGKREIDLLAVGSLIPLKQYHQFIELVCHLKNVGHPNVKAVLIGNGELETELRALIKQYDLDETIFCEGRLSHSEVLEIMNNARIFVHPSSYEGHSTVMLEALYSGCRVISFLPAGTGVIENFERCADLEEMKQAGDRLLSTTLSYRRITVSVMDDSARQIKQIFDLMK
jgi:glycosyltransferase involved in cell wall biosynthesis